MAARSKIIVPARRRITVGDLMAGGGGTSVGVGLAELDLVFVANHWPEAMAHHARKHPGAKHVCQDLTQYDFRRMPRVDIIWASPSCQGHSEAAQPARAYDEELAAAHDHLRTSAWAVISAVLARQPRAFIVENVPEFCEWTVPPILLHTVFDQDIAERLAAEAREVFGPARVTVRKRPAPRKPPRGKPAPRPEWQVLRTFDPGMLYRHWLTTFQLAGYRITTQVLTASKWGVPQRRRRLIIVGHLDQELAIVEPVVADEDEPTLESILDFDAGEWTRISRMNAKKPGAQARARHAHREFKGGPCWGWHASHPAAWARGVDQPANTLTTQNQHYLVCDGEYRLWLVPEIAQTMGFDADYFDELDRTVAIVMAGNAVPPRMAAGVLRQVAATI